MPVPAVAAVAAQYHIPNAAAAKLLSAYEEDKRAHEGRMWIPHVAIDPGKVLRTRERVGDEMTKRRLTDVTEMEAVTCDEKKNTTFIKFYVETKVKTDKEEDTMSRVIRRQDKQEHCPILLYRARHPKGVYIKKMNLEERNSVRSLKVVSTDTCPKMKGENHGFGTELEILRGGRPED